MTNIKITSDYTVWQVLTTDNKGFEFRQDIYFSFGDRRFVIDVLGLKTFGIIDEPIYYN